ncbi:MAG TPA: PIN domain-containing protein [Trichocoleus sp.]|jgi:hypothetical protein
MASAPPVILVFDISALSATSPTEWREFSRVGMCYLPQPIYEEMKLLFDRSPDPDLERIAKAFTRFHASSGWQITDASAHHPALKAPSGQALTRRARISLAVGRCGYGLAQNFSNSMVVLITKDRTLLQRLYEIPCVNLCGIPAESLLQWSRSGQRPVPVSQRFQQFRAAHGLPPNTTGASASYQRTSPTRVSQTPSSQMPLKKAPPTLPGWLPDVVSLILAVGGLAIAGYLIWVTLRSSKVQELFRNPSGQLPAIESQFARSLDTTQYIG